MKNFPGKNMIENDLEGKIKNRLIEVVQEIGKIIPYPKITHKKVVQRALDRKKPFDTKGENGYRDTLIWETIVSVAKTQISGSDIIFICQNPRDFFDMDKWKRNVVELDKNLIKELEAISYKAEKIRCYSSLSSFCDIEILPHLSDIEELEPLITERDFCVALEPFINDNFFEESDFTQEIEFNFDVIDINYVGLIQIVQVLECRKINEFTAMIKVECEVEYNIDAYIYKADYYANSESIGSVTDWNDHYMQKDMYDYIYPEILITYDLKKEKILSVSKYE